MNYIVRSIKVLSVIKITFIYFFLLGIFFDLIYLLAVGLPPRNLNAALSNSVFERMSAGEGIIFMITFAVTFAAFMAMFLGLSALIYNLTSGATGGLRVTLKTENLLQTENILQIKTPPEYYNDLSERSDNPDHT